MRTRSSTSDPRSGAGTARRASGDARRLVIPILFLLSMLVGNHEGRMEDLWLVGIALVLIVILVWDARRRKNAWRSR